MTIFAFLSPDDAIVRLMAGPLIISAIALLIALLFGVPAARKRRDMAIDDPERYARLIAWEKAEKERFEKEMAEAGGAVLKGAKAVAKLIVKK